jgi:hypothetical protein
MFAVAVCTNGNVGIVFLAESTVDAFVKGFFDILMALPAGFHDAMASHSRIRIVVGPNIMPTVAVVARGGLRFHLLQRGLPVNAENIALDGFTGGELVAFDEGVILVAFDTGLRQIVVMRLRARVVRRVNIVRAVTGDAAGDLRGRAFDRSGHSMSAVLIMFLSFFVTFRAVNFGEFFGMGEFLDT